MKDRKFLWASCIVCLSGLVVFFVVPFAISFFAAFFEISADGAKFTFGNFAKVFGSGSFLLALKNTLAFTGVIVLFINAMAYSAALLLKNTLKNQRLVYLLTLPMFVPVVSITPVFADIFAHENLLTKIISLVTGETNYGMLKLDYGYVLIIVIFLWKYTGLHIFIYLSGMMKIPKYIYDAARMDGAGAFAVQRKIVFPLMLPYVCVSIVLVIVNSFKIFKEIYVIYGNYPPSNIYFLQHYIQNQFLKLNYELTAAASYIFLLMLYGLVAALVVYINRHLGEFADE